MKRWQQLLLFALMLLAEIVLIPFVLFTHKEHWGCDDIINPWLGFGVLFAISAPLILWANRTRRDALTPLGICLLLYALTLIVLLLYWYPPVCDVLLLVAEILILEYMHTRVKNMKTMAVLVTNIMFSTYYVFAFSTNMYYHHVSSDSETLGVGALFMFGSVIVMAFLSMVFTIVVSGRLRGHII